MIRTLFSLGLLGAVVVEACLPGLSSGLASGACGTFSSPCSPAASAPNYQAPVPHYQAPVPHYQAPVPQLPSYGPIGPYALSPAYSGSYYAPQAPPPPPPSPQAPFSLNSVDQNSYVMPSMDLAPQQVQYAQYPDNSLANNQLATDAPNTVEPVFQPAFTPMTHPSGYNVPQQIQVASSAQFMESSESEDNTVIVEEQTTTPSPRQPRNFVTYYNQACEGPILTSSAGETMESAAQKCTETECIAANAVPDGKGTFQVDFLGEAQGRLNKRNTYCISLAAVPLRSLRHRRERVSSNRIFRRLLRR